MKKNRLIEKCIATGMIAAMFVSSIAVSTLADAAKLPSFNKKKVEIKVGDTFTINVKNSNKKATVKWKTSKKSVVAIKSSVSKGKKAKAKIVGKKKGTATISAVYKLNGKSRTLKCNVVVKKTNAVVSKPTAQDKTEQQQKLNDFATPAIATPTEITTQQPTAAQTPTQGPTKEPADININIDYENATEVSWYELSISNIEFNNESVDYVKKCDNICMQYDKEKYSSLKQLLPDITVCKYDAEINGKKAEKVSVGNVTWNDESYNSESEDSGFYTFTVYAYLEGTSYKAQYYMVDLDISSWSGEWTIVNPISVNYNGVEYEVLYEDGLGVFDDKLFINTTDNIYDLFSDETKLSFCFKMEGKQYNISLLDSYNNIKIYHEYRNFEEVEVIGKFIANHKVLGVNITMRGVDFNLFAYEYGVLDENAEINRCSDNPYAFYISDTGEVSLKDKYPNILDVVSFKIKNGDKIIDKSQYCNLTWHDESYYDNGCDYGYYSFDVNDETNRCTYYIIQESCNGSHSNEVEKNADDVAALKKIIAEQKANGATVNEDINSSEYTWNCRGRLIEINWNSKNLSGELDMNGLSELRSLSCEGYENEIEDKKLTKINVQNCTKLTYINCSGNNISELDVSKCTELNDLFCVDNNLSVLDVSNCTKILDVYCGYNSISSIDVSECANLINLVCCQNNISVLDVSKCIKLENLDCEKNTINRLDVSNNIKLKYLQCGGNNISELDVSKCAELDILSCDENKITTLELSNCNTLSKDNVRCDSNVIVTYPVGM